MSPSKRKIIYEQCTSIYLICYILALPPSSHTLLKAIDIFEYKLTKSKHRTFKINEINVVEVFKI